MLGIRKYVGISALAAAGVVYHAFSTREQYAFPSFYCTRKRMSMFPRVTLNARHLEVSGILLSITRICAGSSHLCTTSPPQRLPLLCLATSLLLWRYAHTSS